MLKEKVVVRFSKEAYKYNKPYFAHLGRVVAQEFDDEQFTMTFYTFADYSRDDIATIIAEEMAFVGLDQYEILDIEQDYDMVDFNSLQRDVINIGIYRSKRTQFEQRVHYATLIFCLRNREFLCAVRRKTGEYTFAYVHQRHNNGRITLKTCSDLYASLMNHGVKAYELCKKKVIGGKEHELLPMQKMFLAYSIDARIDGVKVKTLYFNNELSCDTAKLIAFQTLGRSADKYIVTPPVQQPILPFAQNFGCPTPDRGYKFFVGKNSSTNTLELRIAKPDKGIDYLPMGVSMLQNMLEYKLILPKALVRIMEKAIVAIKSGQEVEITT